MLKSREIRTKRRSSPGSKTVKLSLNMLRDQAAMENRGLARDVAVDSQSGSSPFWLQSSPFLVARSWMGSFWNELITVSKLITDLITCLPLRHKLSWRETVALPKPQESVSDRTEVRLSNQWGCPGQEAKTLPEQQLILWCPEMGRGSIPPTPPRLPRWAQACRSADLLC